MNTEKHTTVPTLVKCDSCGCAFEPEVIIYQRDGYEQTLFRCRYCGKVYVISVTDAPLRADIAEYNRLLAQNKVSRLPLYKQRLMQRLKTANVKRSAELCEQYVANSATP